jgi:hypothetical protein
LRAAKWEFHVRVGIDAAGHDKFARGIDDAFGFHVQLGANDRDNFALNQNVSFVVVRGGNDAAIANQGFHLRLFLHPLGAKIVYTIDTDEDYGSSITSEMFITIESGPD